MSFLDGQDSPFDEYMAGGLDFDHLEVRCD